MAGAPLAQNFDAKLHRAVWSKISREGLESIPRVHQSFLNVMPSGNALEMEVMYSGLPAVPRVASDTVATPQVSFEISPKVIYRHHEYRYQYVYTKVAADDDQYGIITDVIGTMGEGAAYRMETVAAELFNNGTDANAYSTWDGKAIFAADHELVVAPTRTATLRQPVAPRTPPFRLFTRTSSACLMTKVSGRPLRLSRFTSPQNLLLCGARFCRATPLTTVLLTRAVLVVVPRTATPRTTMRASRTFTTASA